ncbi:hypothetical protein BBJ28_00022678 [Nothophytophthora sp. Chile5]|nr:hypothetical protein BBJ28_00022678 [Nothophytophthora sp. Chile5]
MSGNGSNSSASVGASSGSADAGDVVFTSAPMATTSNSGDSCMWYAGETCQQPRSCQDCLNVAIPDDSVRCSALFGPLGRCTSSSKGSSEWSFPAANFTYCPSSDATCSSCRNEWMKEISTGDLDQSQQCAGTDGCVCIAACEVPNRDALIVWNSCSMYGADSSQIRLVLGLTVGAVLVFMLSVAFARSAMKRRSARRSEPQQAARETRREVRRPAASAHISRLNLAGWTDMREKLVETEKGRLEGGAKPTLSSTSAPTVVVEEEGEGYGPMSPSERHTRL